MKPTLPELKKALAVLSDPEGARDSRDMSVHEALNVVFRASPQQLYELGFTYLEPPEKEEER